MNKIVLFLVALVFVIVNAQLPTCKTSTITNAYNNFVRELNKLDNVFDDAAAFGLTVAQAALTTELSTVCYILCLILRTIFFNKF